MAARAASGVCIVLFTERWMFPVTVFGVAMALQRNPDAVACYAGIRQLGNRKSRLSLDRLPVHVDEGNGARTPCTWRLMFIREVTGSGRTGWYLGRCSPA